MRVRATVMQTPGRDRLEVLADHVVDVDAAGTVTAVAPADGRPVDVDLGDDVVLLPGLVDTHVHAPQWPQLGTGLDLPLERWLFEYTFPLEARYADAAFAGAVWRDLVATLLAAGTTTALYFGARDVGSTTLLARTCAELGQRAYVGRVAMDHPEGTPAWYRDGDAAEGVDDSHRSITEIRALGSPLVHPVITPRFIPACTDALLEGLGALAAATGALVQTHCSESDWAHGHVLERTGRRDAVALDGFGLLRPHTVLAHGNFLDDTDFDLLVLRGAGVAHCPLSNSMFANAVFPLRRALDGGVRVGLGTDIAGGAAAAVLGQCQHAVSASQMLTDGVDPALPAARRGVPGSRVSIVEAFWLATQGGAELLGAPVGLLAPGRSFDAVAVRLGRPGSALRSWPELDDPARRFEKVVRLATADDVEHVWVAGRRVAGAAGWAP